jgi:hypothetical protein
VKAQVDTMYIYLIRKRRRSFYSSAKTIPLVVVGSASLQVIVHLS